MPVVVGKSDEFVKRTTCAKCASVLQYTLSEVQEHKSYDYTGGYDIVKFISCPCCGNKVFVEGY